MVEKQDATAANGQTWYRKYSDGFVIQGAYIRVEDSITIEGDRSVVNLLPFTYPVPLSNVVFADAQFNGSTYVGITGIGPSLTSATVTLHNFIPTSNTLPNYGARYFICGYAA